MAAYSMCQNIHGSKTISAKTKKFLCGDVVKSGFGAKHYKYRCNSANDCCEVGKNCEEDLNKEGSKK